MIGIVTVYSITIIAIRTTHVFIELVQNITPAPPSYRKKKKEKKNYRIMKLKNNIFLYTERGDTIITPWSQIDFCLSFEMSFP